ncbi:MAG: type I DNA topoisomerase [Clostridia bacterium]|nr:type I DNA topoisomerase [Clostridia bacterium]
MAKKETVSASAKKLIIVESPTKVKTIKKYLGSGYEVTASKGHIRDLPKSQLGVDIENNFEPKYIPIRGKAELIKELKAKVKTAGKVYLATDPDREGEAISWHLAHILGIKTDEENRVTFNEITKEAVKKGLENPRKIDMDLVDAYQARRILDRIVGYKLSPFLWRKVKKGLSAGRVQSVATRLVVEKEEEIEAFIPKEYHVISALLKDDKNKEFAAKFHGKSKKIEISDSKQANDILEKLNNAEYIVSDIKVSKKSRKPSPPFTTSTLQQEALRRLNMSSKRTMSVAQELYEGVNIKNDGMVGLITYMRTDSLRIADSEREKAKDFIIEKYGSKFYPKTPRIYKTKSGAQDAHEAIRPTVIGYEPSKIKEDLSKDQYRLYKLIYERFLASQMASMEYDLTNVDIKANDYIFKASGSVITFPGFTALYEDKKDDPEEENIKLPKLEIGQKLELLKLSSEQKFTQPPARYTEGTLIKALEENGIGRPSTYAPTITTITQRGYVEKEGKNLVPTPLGKVTTELMKDNFSNIVDISFTANMENNLDKVENGDEKFKGVIKDFYTLFENELTEAEKKLEGTFVKIPDEETDEICELCGNKMVVKTGKFGKFLACKGYPECKNTRAIVVPTEGLCPKCGGNLVQRKSKTGKKYFSCQNYPKCDFMSWDEPIKEICPVCQKTLFIKSGWQKKIVCHSEGCSYERSIKK